VPWYCTINEPTALSTGGYMSDWGFPPRVVDVRKWRLSIDLLIDAHKRSVAAIHELSPGAKAGLAAFTGERKTNAGGRPAVEYATRMNEDIYLEATDQDDFIGVQTYTRTHLFLPRIAAPLTRLALAVRPIEDRVAARLLGLKTAAPGTQALAGTRVTQMGWEYRPEALAAVVRRISRLCPNKDLVVTENGVATEDDTERVEFIARALAEHPEEIVVKEICGQQISVLELRAAKVDLGKIIGKEGRNAHALRTILNAAATKLKKRAVLEILE